MERTNVPDIVAEKYYGIEVKSTVSDKWKSVGSRILETTREETWKTSDREQETPLSQVFGNIVEYSQKMDRQNAGVLPVWACW